MIRTISDLLAEVPEGQSRTFRAPVSGAKEHRYVEVSDSWSSGAPVAWNNRPPPGEGPWMGARPKPRIGLASIGEPDLSFRKNLDKLVDFYSTPGGAFIISQKLLDVIEDMDPGSLEISPAIIKAKNGKARYYFVMPVRNLSAVDVSKTDVIVEDELYHTTWIRRVKFPNGAIFDGARLKGMHNFSDIDAYNRWFWSQDLVDAAKAACVRGLYTTRPGGLASEKVDLL